MKNLNQEELVKVEGGSVTAGVAIFGGICVVVSFLASVIYGFVHPRKCD